MPRLWCTYRGSTGNAIPMMRNPINTTVMIGSNADVTERTIAMDGSVDGERQFTEIALVCTAVRQCLRLQRQDPLAMAFHQPGHRPAPSREFPSHNGSFRPAPRLRPRA